MSKFITIKDIQIVKKPNGKASLGSGAFSSVKLVCHKDNPKIKYALKELQKKNEAERNYIFKEIDLHKNLVHENIIRFIDYIEEKDKIYLILEHALHGDLFTYLQKKNYEQKELLEIYYKACKGIQYLHKKNIMHRDLKPENILVCENNQIKLCDFGWSAKFQEDEVRETLCGTFEYMAPEVYFKTRQTKKTDIWALGILLYELFHRYAPFQGNRMDLIVTQIMKKQIRYKQNIDSEIKKLISTILVIDPRKRPTIDQILKNTLFDQFKDIPQIPQKSSLTGSLSNRQNDTSPFSNIPRKVYAKSPQANFYNSNASTNSNSTLNNRKVSTDIYSQFQHKDLLKKNIQKQIGKKKEKQMKKFESSKRIISLFDQKSSISQNKKSNYVFKNNSNVRKRSKKNSNYFTHKNSENSTNKLNIYGSIDKQVVKRKDQSKNLYIKMSKSRSKQKTQFQSKLSKTDSNFFNEYGNTKNKPKAYKKSPTKQKITISNKNLSRNKSKRMKNTSSKKFILEKSFGHFLNKIKHKQIII